MIRCNTHNLDSNPSLLGDKEKRRGYINENIQNSYLPISGEFHVNIYKYITHKVDIFNSKIIAIITIMMVIIQL